MTKALLGLALVAACSSVWADAVQTLREFVRDVRSGRGSFTQTVVSPDGARRKASSGSFEFVRPNRFRFAYHKPFEQLIVADGARVWTHDSDLNQVSVRALPAVLGSTPAAILAGGSLEQDFELEPQAAKDGLERALARPKRGDGPVQAVRVGFRGRELAAIEIVDAFGQRSLLQFSDLKTNRGGCTSCWKCRPRRLWRTRPSACGRKSSGYSTRKRSRSPNSPARETGMLLKVAKAAERDKAQRALGDLVILDKVPGATPEELRMTLQGREVKRIEDLALRQSLETIRNRGDQFGVTEPHIIPEGDRRIVVQLPGIKDPQRAINLIGKTALLELKAVDDSVNPEEVAQGKVSLPPDREVYFLLPGRARAAAASQLDSGYHSRQ